MTRFTGDRVLSHVFAVAISRPLLEACVETLITECIPSPSSSVQLDPKPLWGAIFILLVAFAFGRRRVHHSRGVTSGCDCKWVADAPVANTLAASPGDEAAVNNPVSENGSATISGTVLDTNGSEAKGARVELDGRTASGARARKPQPRGIHICRASPGAYRITSQVRGWEPV